MNPPGAMAGGVTEVLAPVPISPGQARPVIRILSHSNCGEHLLGLETVWLGSRSLLPPGQEAYVLCLWFAQVGALLAFALFCGLYGYAEWLEHQRRCTCNPVLGATPSDFVFL